MFTLDSDYNITAYAGAVPAREDQIAFATVEELSRRTAEWPLQNLVNLWNSFAGVPPFGDLKPVNKFENRAKAIRRIWEAIQNLAPAPPAAELQSDDMPKPTKKARVRAQAAHKRAVAKPAADTTRKPREGTRKETVLNLIGRKQGSTIGEIMEATGWQPHSVRGFIATLHTKHGVEVTSTKNAAGERVYQAARR